MAALGAAASVAAACANTGQPCPDDRGAAYRATNDEQHSGALLWLRCAEGDLFSCDEARDFDLPRLQRRKEAIIDRDMECAKIEGESRRD